MFQKRLAVVKIHHGSLRVISISTSRHVQTGGALDIPKESLPWSSICEDVVDGIEVEKGRGHFEYPVGLNQDDSYDVDEADSLAQERLVLHPCDDIVHRPAGVEENSSSAEIPSVCGRVREDESALEHSKDEL